MFFIVVAVVVKNRLQLLHLYVFVTCSARNCGFICSSVIHGLVGEGYRLEEQCQYKSNYRLSLLFQSTFKTASFCEFSIFWLGGTRLSLIFLITCGCNNYVFFLFSISKFTHKG